MTRLAIVGGGWAGLAAAITACEKGAEVRLFEAGRTLGGRARGVTLDGRRLDNGQHILLGAYRQTLRLMRTVGADPDTLLDRRPLTLQDNAGFKLSLPRWPAPFNLAMGLATARGVPWREKIAATRFMQALQASAFRLPQDQTVAAWLDAAGQQGVLRQRLWAPLCLAALNLPAERASAQVFARVLQDSLGSPLRADTDLLLPRADLGALFPEATLTWLQQKGAEILTSRRVRTIDPQQRTVDGAAFDAIIVACAPQHAGQLLPGWLPAFDFEPIATLYLAYPPEIALPFPLIALQGGIGQWLVDRGQGLIAAVQSGHGAWENFSDPSLARQISEEAGLPWPPRWQRTIREQRATFSCRPGLSRPATATRAKGLFLAGDYTDTGYPATLEGAVRSGIEAARQALA